jgi:microcystin-dependent protein
MVDQYIGEIKLLGFNFAPIGWALCQGQILPISQNAALFSLLGTMYGGNGQQNFALPDLQGRAAGHVGPSLYTPQGLKTGTETVTVQLPQYPQHTHSFNVNSDPGNEVYPTGRVLATPHATPPNGPNIYTIAQGAQLQPLNTTGTPPTLAPYVGGNQPHENMMPFLVMTYAIAMTGIFPARP